MPATYPTGNVFASKSFQALREIVEEVSRGPGAEGDFEHFERDLHRRVMAWEAEVVGQQLARYDLDAPEIEIDGEIFRWKMKSEQEYCGQAGTFKVTRSLYVPRFGGGKAICPLELGAGIVGGSWTPLAARLMARAVASTTPNEAEQLFDELGGMKPSSSSLDRLPKRLSEEWEESRTDFEAEIRSQEQIPAEAVSVAVSLDGVQLPMKDGEREAKRSKENKLPQGPAGYKEVGCGTVSYYNAGGERIETIRYARMPEPNKATLKSQLDAELKSIFASRPDLDLVLLADGAPNNWEYLDTLPEKLGRKLDPKKQVVDLFHVLERVQLAMNAYHGEQTSEAKVAFEECRIWLREEDDGAERVIRSMRYRRDRSRGAARAKIETQIKYFEKRKHRMRYKSLLDQKLPVGSGVVEAACKTLVTERLRRSGMSWREEGGQAILALRSLIQSKRWERGWALLASQYRSVIVVRKAA